MYEWRGVERCGGDVYAGIDEAPVLTIRKFFGKKTEMADLAARRAWASSSAFRNGGINGAIMNRPSSAKIR